MPNESTDNRASAAPQSATPRAPAVAPAPEKRADEAYAATGMGRPTGHAVTEVWLNLEDAPSQVVDIRYEFHAQLVKLGILRSNATGNGLERRERARGFEPGFCPAPPRRP